MLKTDVNNNGALAKATIGAKYLFFLFVILSFLWACVLFIFNVREPGFTIPVENQAILRYDAYGDGHFGAKRSGGRKHAGIDISAPIGAPVVASKSGIATCMDLKKGYGKLVIIEHIGGFQTRYAHLSAFGIKKRQWVSQSQRIGAIGKTGNANHSGIKPHLHFEIRRNGKLLDPSEFIEVKSPSGYADKANM